MSNKEVSTLIAAVKEHQKFRQLACYSIECVTKVISPGNRDYKANLAASREAGAAKVVIDVLRRHAGKEDVLAVCCECLSKLAADTSNAEVIAAEGGVEAILNTIQANPHLPQDALIAALAIVDSLSEHAAAVTILAERDVTSSLKALMEVPNQRTEVTIGCLNSLGKLSASTKGLDSVMECIPSVLSSLQRLSSEGNSLSAAGHAAVLSGVKLLTRVVRRDASSLEAVKSAGGLDVALSVLEVDKSQPNSVLGQSASKLMQQLCGANSVDSLLTTLKQQTNLSEAAQEHMLGMLSSLSISSSSSAEIVKSGGVKLLIQSAESKISTRQLESTIRTLLRLANNHSSINELVQNGAITTLLKPLRNAATDASTVEMQSMCIQALSKISAVAPEQVAESGAVPLVMQSFSNLRDKPPVVAAAVQFLETMSSAGQAQNILSGSDYGTIIDTIRDGTLDNRSLATSLKLMSDLATSESTLSSFITAGLVETIVDVLPAKQSSMPVLKEGFNLLSSLLVSSDAHVRIQDHSVNGKSGVETLVQTVCNRNVLKDPNLKKNASELICQLSSDEMVFSIFSEISSLVSRSTESSISATDVQSLVSMATLVTGFAIIPENINKIASVGGADTLVQLLSVVNDMPATDEHLGAMCNICRALEEILPKTKYTSAASSGVPDAIGITVNLLQKHGDSTPLVESATALLQAVSGMSEEVKQTCIRSDMLETLSSVMRLHQQDVQVIQHVAATYQNIASSGDTVALELCSRNASKGILQSIEKCIVNADAAEDVISTPESEAWKKNASTLLEVVLRLSYVPEGRTALRKQGVNDVVLNAAHLAAQSHRDNVQHILTQTLTVMDGKAAAEELSVQLNTSGVFVPSGASTSSVEKSLRAMHTLQIIAQQPDNQATRTTFAELNVKSKIESCLSNFSNALTASSSGASFSDAQMQLIDSSIQALSAISQIETGDDAAAKSLDLPVASSIMPLLLHSAELPTASSEVFRTIARIGTHNPVIMESLCETSFPTTLLSICKNDSLTGAAAAAAFECFAVIAANPVVYDTIAPTTVAPIVCQRIADSLVDDNMAAETLPALIGSLSALTEGSAGLSLQDVTHTIADVVDYFGTVMEKSTDGFDDKPAAVSGSMVAQSMAILKNLVINSPVSKVLEGAPAALDKLVSIASRNDYELLRDEQCAVAFSSLVEAVVVNDDTNTMLEYMKTSLEIQEPLLQAMNFHSSDMSLQRQVASVVSKFGVEGLVSSVSKVVERVDNVILNLTPLVPTQEREAKLLQIAESARVMNNLLLLDTAGSGGFDSTQIYTSMIRAVETVNICVSNAENEVVRSDADETLAVCIQALSKVLAVDGALASSSTLVNTVLPVAVENIIANPSATTAKASAVHLLRMITDTASTQSLLEIVQTPAYQTMCKTLLQQQGKLAISSSSNHQDPSGLVDMKNVAEKVTSRLLSQASLSEIAIEANSTPLLLELFNQASLLSATATKKSNFTASAVLKNIVSCPALGHAAAINLLSSIRDDTAYTSVTTEIINVLLNAHSAGVDITGGRTVDWDGIVSTFASSTHALEMKVLPLIEAAAVSVEGGKAIAKNMAALERVCGTKGLTNPNPDTALQCAVLLTQLAAHQDPAVLESLQSPSVVKAMLTAMKESSTPNKANGEEIVQSVVYVLRLLSDVQGLDKLNLPRETIRLLQDALLRYPTNEYIRDTSSTLVTELSASFSIGPEAQLEERYQTLAAIATNQSNNWVAVKTEQDQIYYYNSVDGSTQWEQPVEHITVQQEVDSMLALITTQMVRGAADVETKSSDVAALVGLTVAYQYDSVLNNKLLDLVHTQVVESGAAEKYAELDESVCSQFVAALTNQQNGAGQTAESLTKAVAVAEELQKLQQFSACFGTDEYIRSVCAMVTAHTDKPVLARKGISLIGKICRGSKQACCIVSELGFTSTLATLLATYLNSDEDLIDLCVTLLIVLAEKLEDTVKVLSDATLLYVLPVLSSRADGVLLKCIRLLGCFSLSDDCIPSMLEQRVVYYICQVVSAKMGDKKLVKVSMDLLANLCALEDEECEIDPTTVVIDDGGFALMLQAASVYDKDPDTLLSVFEAMYNAFSADSVDFFIQKGVPTLLYSALTRHDDHKKLVGVVLQLFTVFAETEAGLTSVFTGTFISLLLSLLENYPEKQAMAASVLTLFSAVFAFDEARACFAGLQGGVVTLLHVMQMYFDDQDMILHVLGVLQALSGSDALSVQIAEFGCHLLVEAVAKHVENTVVLAQIFDLLGRLAFIKSNLRSIVQHGGIKLLLDTAEVFADDELLMVSVVTSIDNIVTADEEYAAIVLDKGGRAAVEKVKTLYGSDSDSDVMQAVNSCLLSMSARARVKDREGTKTSKGALFARLGNLVDASAAIKGKEVRESSFNANVDHLTSQNRTFLRNGQVLTDYVNGVATQRHMFVSGDCEFIMLKDTAAKSKMLRKIPIKGIITIQAGLGSGHYHRSITGTRKTSCDEAKCIFMECNKADDEVTIELSSTAERDKWLQTLQPLVAGVKAGSTFLKAL